MKSLNFIFAFFIVALIFSSCGIEEKTVTLNLPLWPPEQEKKDYYPALDAWIIKIADSDGITEKVYHSNTKKITLKTYSQEVKSVLAFPVTNGFCFFKPAGAIIPYKEDFSWEQGFSANILYTRYNLIHKKSLQIDSTCESFFNWNKFCATIEKNTEKNISSSLPYNPWLLDKSAILHAIDNKKFSVNLLNLKNCISLEDSLFLEKEISVFLSDYIPFNRTNGQKSILLNEINCFLCPENLLIATVTSENKKNITLALNSLPIYTFNYEE